MKYGYLKHEQLMLDKTCDTKYLITEEGKVIATCLDQEKTVLIVDALNDYGPEFCTGCDCACHE